MPYVYAVVFNSGIVKFGRSSNPFNRVRDHVTAAKHHGIYPFKVFMSAVNNDAREEEMLLDSAYDRLEQVSRESYKAVKLDDVAEVFRDRRLPFIISSVSVSPYKLIIDSSSFDEYLDGPIEEDVPAKMAETIPNYKIRKLVYSVLVGTEGEMTTSQVGDRLPNKKLKDVSAAMTDMLNEGSLELAQRYLPHIKRYTLTKLGEARYQ